MPKTSPFLTQSRMEKVELCAQEVSSVPAAFEKAEVPLANWPAWKTRDPEWAERVKAATLRYRSLRDGKTRRQADADAAIHFKVPEVIDFLTFRERFFGHTTNWYHQDAYKRIESNDRLVMLLPPEHAKTTTWAIEFVTYKLMLNPDLRIVVIQKSQNEAKKIIAAVKARLTDHEFYQAIGIAIEDDPITIYGGKEGFKPEREDGLSWAAEHFYLRGRSMAEKDPSLQAKGATSAILGNRIDLMIVDDVQDTKNYTPQGLDALSMWWTHSLMSRLGDQTRRHSKVIVLGSRIGPGDFYEWLEDEYCLIEGEEYPEEEVRRRWPLVKYPAVLDEENREILWPEYWTWDGLMQKKFEVKDKWWSNWMQVQGQEDGATFKRERLLDARDRDLVVGVRPPQVTDVVVGVDPAIRRFCAIVVWGVDRKTGMRYLVDIVNREGMGNWDNVASLTVELAQRYNAQRVVVETNNTQGDVFQRVESGCRKVGIRCVGYQTVTASGARAEETEFSISSVGALFDEGMIVLPYGDMDSAKKVDAYIAQLTNWRPRPPGASSWHLVRDMVMATLFAESEARLIVRRSRSDRPQWKSRAPKFARKSWGRWAS